MLLKPFLIEVKLDRGRHLCIVTISEGIKMITGKDSGVVDNLNTSLNGTA